MSKVCNTARLSETPTQEYIRIADFQASSLPCKGLVATAVAIVGHAPSSDLKKLSRGDSQLAFLVPGTRDRASAFAHDLHTHEILAAVTCREVKRRRVGPFGKIARYAEHPDSAAL